MAKVSFMIDGKERTVSPLMLLRRTRRIAEQMGVKGFKVNKIVRYTEQDQHRNRSGNGFFAVNTNTGLGMLFHYGYWPEYEADIVEPWSWEWESVA